MNREDILFYLENIKNLEVIKHNDKSTITAARVLIEEKKKSIKLSSYALPEVLFFVSGVLSILFVWGALALYFCESFSDNFIGFLLELLQWPLIFFLGGMGLFCVGTFLVELVKFIIETVQTKKENNARLRKTPETEEEIKRLETLIQSCEEDTKKVDELLSLGYNLNIVPLQYRSLLHILYIWSYMATSQASFDAALLHSHIESGIKEISSRLNIIIQQNMQIIRGVSYLSSRVTETNRRLNSVENGIQRNYYMALSGYYSSCGR